MIRSVVRQLRLHQWVKNLLLGMPLLLAHRIDDVDALRTVILAILAFCLAASAIYVVNDVVDLDADRAHPTKRHRPLAAGTLRVRDAMVMVPILIGLSATISIIWLPPTFATYLIIYVAVTTAYSFGVKRMVIVDVLVLSCLYTLRLLAGGEAVGVIVSPWLLTLSMFLFTSLAFLKRYTELLDVEERRLDAAHGRGYRTEDLMMVRTIGPSVGFLAVLVFVQYINSTDVTRLYTHPLMLWLAVPPLMYWMAHMWMTANRRVMHDDPIVFALRDPASYIVAIIIGVIAVVAR